MSSNRNRNKPKTPVAGKPRTQPQATAKPPVVKEETAKQTPAEFYQARRDKAVADGKA